MGLDVYLLSEQVKSGGTGIFIREKGHNREITRAEWDERFPGREPVVAGIDNAGVVYSANITHNLTEMAVAACLYRPLWRPEEVGIRIATDLVMPLNIGLVRLEANPEYYKTLNPVNGWGDYDGLVSFVSSYLRACEENPDALVKVSR